MSIKEQLEVDILKFFKQIESQTENDQRITLRNLMDKYLHLSSVDHLLDDHDLRMVIGDAKHKFVNDKMPVYLGKKKRLVNPVDLPNLCVIEATIGYLNKLDCLKKLPKFDRQEDKF